MRGMKRKAVLGVLVVTAAVLALLYVGGMLYFKSHFLPGTVINGLNASGSNVERLKDKLAEYQLTVEELAADGSVVEKNISGDQIKLELTNEGQLEDILKKQNHMAWFLSQKNDYKGLEIVACDKEALNQVVSQLEGMSEESRRQPENAYVSEYKADVGYEVVPEVYGNVLKQDKTVEAIRQALCAMEEKVSLKEAGCYQEPEVTAEDEGLQKAAAALNKYVKTKITYRFGDKKEVLDGSTISQWISEKNGKVKLDKKQVEAYVASLRSKYDTIFGTRTFKTSYGSKVTVTGGDYGWWMNSAEETKELIRQIKKGKSGKRTPVYYQTAASYGKPDYGNTYVEVNLTAQHMLFYKNGKKILESDFVSGNPTYGNATPEGVYGITYKERKATLVGENYSTPVDFWMPFNKNIGLHDATWRSSFGGSIYKSSGSHGCVNLPYDIAQRLFAQVDKGTPVICYQLPGSEGKKPGGSRIR